MSLYFKLNGKPRVLKYTKHGRTKQSQVHETDINKLLERAGREGTLSHLEKYQGNYGDFAGFDFETQANVIAKGQTMFEELPAEIKREFSQSPQQFFEFVNNPENAGELPRLLPALAARGTQLPIFSVPDQIQADILPAEQGAGTATAPSGAQGSEATENPSPPATEVQNDPPGS